MSENIPYIIAEDGYYYVAYKEKVKVPEIVVSAKGIANGLSEEYNDGWDFGPDSYSPTSTSAIPYTQTVGTQEALNYAGSIARYSSSGTGYILPPILLLAGKYTLNADVTLPYFSNITNGIPTFTILGQGSGLLEFGTTINLNGYNIILGNASGIQTASGGFLIQGIGFYSYSNTLSSLKFLGNFAANPNLVMRDIASEGVAIDFSGASTLAQLNLDNIFIFSDNSSNGRTQFLSPTKTYQLSITNGTFKCGFYSNGLNQIGAVNFAEGIQINSGDPNFAFNVWEIDSNNTSYAGKNGITNNTASGSTSNLTLDVGTLVINTDTNFWNYGLGNDGTGATGSTSVGTLNVKMHIKHLVFQTNIMNFAVPSGSGINIEEFTVDEITNNTTSDISTANLPILSSTSGTTAGTVDMRFTEYASSHKKIIITFDGYENDTTTDQTIDFPMAFASYDGISLNTTGLTISPTTSGIVITAPDSTTTYSGIVIVEGY